MYYKVSKFSLQGYSFWWEYENLHFSKYEKKSKNVYKHFYFFNISAWENDKILIFFAKDAPWKALQILHKPILLTCYGGFFLAQLWTTYIVLLLLSRIKMSERHSCLQSYNLCRVFEGASFKKKFKILSFSQVEIFAKQKSAPIFVFCWELVVPYRLLILSNKQATIASQQNWFMQNV